MLLELPVPPAPPTPPRPDPSRRSPSKPIKMTPQLHESPRPSSFLLRLPPPIRRRIYLYLGLARWDGTPPELLDLDGAVHKAKQEHLRGLMLSCQAIYSEASALLFSSNQFVIHYRSDIERSLQPLQNLTASSLASLTSLKIVLNQDKCHHRRHGEGWSTCCDDPRFKGTRVDHGKPLQSSHYPGSMLDEWLQTADYLSPRISPRVLQLSLVCDLDQEDVTTAAKVVAPLASLPELKSCHVRLCTSPNAELSQIARHAALQACRRLEPQVRSPSSGSSLALLNLARELRHRILEYTDLVTPWKEVMWTRAERGRYVCAAQRCFDSGGIPGPPCSPARHHGCRFRACHRQERIEKGHFAYPDFCHIRHAAFSPTCRCWAPPTPLFLICRAFCEDARFVFFSMNRFVVSDTLASRSPYDAVNVFNNIELAKHGLYWECDNWLGAQPPRSYPAEGLAVSQFLREVVPTDCLGHLRFLELVFPPYNHECWPRDGHPALRDWTETVDWAKDKINTPGITLRLTMAGSLLYPPQHPDQRKEVTQAQGDEVLAGYDRIIKPLACLGAESGLTRFYADFAWPWKWTTWAHETHLALGGREAALNWTREKEDALNERAERVVLGDRYEGFGSSDGRLEERFWRQSC